ncbi:reverse transcriptase [Pycnococcus provasolii]
MQGKSHRPMKKRNPKREKEAGTFIHCDIKGPLEHEGIAGERYMIHFTDDSCNFSETYAITHKSDAASCFRHFHAQAKALGHSIKRLRTDNDKPLNEGELPARHNWMRDLFTFLRDYGFQQSMSDTSLWFKYGEDGKMDLMIFVHTDDGKIAGRTQEINDDFMKALKMKFNVGTHKKGIDRIFNVKVQKTDDGNVKLNMVISEIPCLKKNMRFLIIDTELIYRDGDGVT